MSGSERTPIGAEAAAAGAAWDTLAREAAGARSGSDQPLSRRELLAFELASDLYAVPVERVREVVRMRTITPMPRVPEAVRGVISLRGEVIQVVDLRRRLGLPAADAGRRSRIIVLHGEDGSAAGLLVDAVTEVLRLPEEAIRPTAPGESESVEALCARGDDFVSLLNLDRVLDLDAER